MAVNSNTWSDLFTKKFSDYSGYVLSLDDATRVLKAYEAGGAGSEVWNRVYMIAPVKKFGRVRLSTNFPSKQIWRRMQTCGRTMSFCSVLGFPTPKHQEKVFMNFFNGIFGHQEA